MCFSDSPIATPLNTIVDLKNFLYRNRLLLLLVKLRMDHKLFAKRAQTTREPQDTLHTNVHQHPVCAHLGSPRALALPEVARIAALASPVLCGLPLLRSGLKVCLGCLGVAITPCVESGRAARTVRFIPPKAFQIYWIIPGSGPSRVYMY